MYPSDDAKSATEKAMALLLHKDRTRHELKSRLEAAGFDSESVEFAISYVDSFNYLDDLRYAETYIRYHFRSRSRREITEKLKSKGVSDEDIREGFDSVLAAKREEGDDTDPEIESIEALLNKRLKGRDLSELTYEEKQKQMRYLSGKGYPADKIRKMILLD